MRAALENSPTEEDDDADRAEPVAAGSTGEGDEASLAGLLRAGQDWARNVADLAAAEVRLAATSAVTIGLLFVLAAVLAIVAWGLLASVAAYLLVAAGASWAVAGTAVAAVHAVAAFLCWRGARRLTRHLTLPSLRRSLLGGDP